MIEDSKLLAEYGAFDDAFIKYLKSTSKENLIKVAEEVRFKVK